MENRNKSGPVISISIASVEEPSGIALVECADQAWVSAVRRKHNPSQSQTNFRQTLLKGFLFGRNSAYFLARETQCLAR